ncbi:MAG: ornithine cyclodeaminase family protein, partial [Acidimicrobiia bacterium]
MKTRILDRHHVGRIVREVGRDGLMDEMVAALTEAILQLDERKTVVRARDGFQYSRPDVGLVEWMPVLADGEDVTIKVVGYHPTNPADRSLPTIVATVSVYDTRTGHLAGLVDGTFLTALRTGAASAVASRVLAKPDASTVGLVGCGAQAVTQLHAMARTFDLERVLIHDLDRTAVDTFPDRVVGLLPAGVSIEVAPLADVLAASDVVCTQTSIPAGKGPLFERAEVRPWLHVNAVGSDLPGKVELPRS